MTRKARIRYEQILLAAINSKRALKVIDTENNRKNVVKLFKADVSNLDKSTVRIIQMAIENWELI